MAPFLFPQMCGGVSGAAVEVGSEWRRFCSHRCVGGCVGLLWRAGQNGAGNVPIVLCGGLCWAAVEGLSDWCREMFPELCVGECAGPLWRECQIGGGNAPRVMFVLRVIF